MGHAPMFANKEFAIFSHQIGLASIGASETDLLKIAAIYWYTIEFGLCIEDGHWKVYGAGILSSSSEIEWALSKKANILSLDCDLIA